MFNDDTILKLPEACEMLRISQVTMRRLLKKGTIPAHKVGGQWRFISKELLEWVKTK